MIIKIRHLLSLRPHAADRVLLDYLTLVTLAPPGQVGVQELRQRWSCTQSTVSRRVHNVAAAGLAEVSTGYGSYAVHAVSTLDEAA